MMTKLFLPLCSFIKFSFFLSMLIFSNASVHASPQARPILDVFNEAMALRSRDHEKSSQLYLVLNERENELADEYRLELVYLEAYLLMMQGEYDKAITTHSNLTMVKNPNLALRAYANMLTIELLRRDYLAASSYMIPMLEILETDSINLELRFANYAYDIIGTFYNHLGNFEKGFFYLSKVTPSAYESRDLCNFQVQMVKTELILNKIDFVSPKIVHTIELCRSVEEDIMLQGFLADIGWELIKRGKYQESINILSEELPAVELSNFSMGTAEFYSFLAKSYFELGNDNMAEHFALKTLDFSHTLAEPLPHRLALEVLYEQSKTADDAKKSYQLLQQLIAAKEAYSKTEQLKVLGREQVKVDFNDLIQDIQKYHDQVELENIIKAKKAKNREIFSLYVFFERLIHLALIALLLYQLRHFYIELKSINKEKKKLVLDKTSMALNRHIFIHKAKAVLSNSMANDKTVALILFNIDKFRQVNHFQGNDRADRLLKNGILKSRECLPDKAFIGRLGGDEFAIILPNTHRAQALEIAEKIRYELTQVEDQKLSFKFSFTASFGVTDTQLSGYQFFQLIIDADSVISESKNLGGNATLVYRPEQPVT